MGLDYRYLLYFKREDLWDALQGVVDIAEPHDPPVHILFPDKLLAIPFDSWGKEGEIIEHDKPEISFTTVLRFAEDEALFDYALSHHIEEDLESRSPLETGGERLLSIGYIYLTIYQEIPDHPRSDLVLFDFGTTGTRMSKLFYYSTSIRKTFLNLLKKYHGVCGVFNHEEYGELFWMDGRECSEEIDDPFMLPEEIKAVIHKDYLDGDDD
jgi:hypothetical protein